MRLIPPKRRPRRHAASEDADTQRWAKGLHRGSRRTLAMVVGNALLLLVLVGGPIYRGQRRARATFVAHAAFTGCLLGARTAAPVGIGPARDEPERFASRVFARDSTWPAKCLGLLRRVAPESAVFILPGLKLAEQRVREAARVLEVELSALRSYREGSAVAVRPMRATALLREAVRMQGAESGLLDLPLHSVIDDSPPTLKAPASLPLYASREAVVTIWGDDHALRVLAIDQTGISYLEAEAGTPYRRARLVRPASLRGLFRGSSGALLLWTTPEERCRERAAGCHGKTSGIAVAPEPLFELPVARYVAAHVAGRADRSLAVSEGRLHLAVANANRRVSLQGLLFSAAMVESEDLPPIVPSSSALPDQDEILLREGPTRLWVLGSAHDGNNGLLSWFSPEGPLLLASFRGAEPPWMSACVAQDTLSYVAGDGSVISLGRILGNEARAFASLPLSVSHPIHPQDPSRDRVAPLCTRGNVLAIVHADDDRLLLVRCGDGDAACSFAEIAAQVHRFAALATPAGALIAFEQGTYQPQIYLRRFDLSKGSLSKSQSPAACWTSSRGMCGAPILERLGNRVILAAREGTDLVLLESADEGITWSTPSVL